MSDGIEALTDKEKQTLRLVLVGYDAKSMACKLDLSVHTINERLRCARRKLGVSSSRAAARMLNADGDGEDNLLAHKPMGEASSRDGGHLAANRKPGSFPGWYIGGIVMMTSIAAAIALAVLAGEGGAQQVQTTGKDVAANGQSEMLGQASVQSAPVWLNLVDEGRWDESWGATGGEFQSLNTSERWASVSQEVRVPLGSVQSRDLIEQQFVPTPPHGASIVRFRTSFSNRGEVTETLSLIREEGEWRVVGYVLG